MKFKSLLVANRGEIALRVMRTAKRMGLRTIAVYSDADRDAPHVGAADSALHIGGSAPRDSYLNMDALLKSDAEAVHPGYGFLSENAAFAERVIKAGRVWVGPPPQAMRALGDKQRAKVLARQAGVPGLPGYDGDDQSDAALTRAAREAGFPLMIKAAAGGGGRGMRLVRSEAELAGALRTARSEAEHAFGDGRLLLERAVDNPRHVEVQIFADSKGGFVHLGERDCSVQRRHQKLIEESPAPGMTEAAREKLGAAALQVVRAAGYVGAGTVEFLGDRDGRFWFMEVNTRLQVEHPVTEAVTGIDLVEWQLRVAAGEALPLRQEQIRLKGHAIEARLCAEKPLAGHLPQAGRLALWRPEDSARVDHALESGIEITPHYDSLLAKVIVHADSRDAARERLAAALEHTVALGIPTNRTYLAWALRDAEFAAGRATTTFAEKFHPPGLSATHNWTAAALGAVLLAETRAAAAGHGELTSWSNNPAREVRLKLKGDPSFFGEVGLRFEHGRYQVKADRLDMAVRLHRLEEGKAVFELHEGARVEVPFCVENDRVHLAYWHGESWSFEDLTHRPAARGGGGVLGGLYAPMNGKVVDVKAAAGDEVDEGKVLIVMEAMKMEHQLLAPGPGKRRVKAVHVALGAQVAPGQPLVEFERAAA